MKRMAWHWTLAVSAMALAFAACTVNSDDDDQDGGAGSGGSTGGSGGSSAAGGTGGAAGTGGGAGAAGAAGSGDLTCQEAYDGTDACSTCLVASCCDEVEACINEKDDTGAPKSECSDSWDCLVTTCQDPNTYEDCKANCDGGNYNGAYSDLTGCLETSCFEGCS